MPMERELGPRLLGCLGFTGIWVWYMVWYLACTHQSVGSIALCLFLLVAVQEEVQLQDSAMPVVGQGADFQVILQPILQQSLMPQAQAY